MVFVESVVEHLANIEHLLQGVQADDDETQLVY
jgi:hypothetical protein